MCLRCLLVTDETSGETEPQDAAEWITALGIVDVESGGAKAKEAREPLIDAGRKALSSGDQYTTAHLVFAGQPFPLRQ